MKRAIVTPDKHFPLEDKKAINVVCQAIELVKPDIYIDLGDTGEWQSVSHWQWKKKKRPPLEYQLPFVYKEIEAVNKGMDKAGTKERHFTEGNHKTGLIDLLKKIHTWLKTYSSRMHSVLMSVDTSIIKSERCSKLVRFISIMVIILQELTTLVIIFLGSVVMLCMVTIMIFSKALLHTLMGSSQRGQ